MIRYPVVWTCGECHNPMEKCTCKPIHITPEQERAISERVKEQLRANGYNVP